ncbi:hypothetical protein BJX63DRAFT_441025 [Aspergillus granulosus]|uniref:Uncharacterized protein n=1 Tax=Aspergillus granulosus TaxID=176169 RepID=A0ABR4HNW7_9EURO
MDQPQSLRTACAHPDTLFATAPETLIRLLYREFPHDINRLRRAYSLRTTTDHPSTPSPSPSPSHILFNEVHDEVNRTLTSFLALRWIHLDAYEAFVASQPPETRLTRASFAWLRSFYTQTILNTNTNTHVNSNSNSNPDPDPSAALYALITSIITNDLGKDPSLAREYHSATGLPIAHQNHDAILHAACTVDGLLPSLEALPGAYKELVRAGIALGATFNFGQLAQAENAPVALEAVRGLHGWVQSQTQDQVRGQGQGQGTRVLELRFLEQVLDLAGAAGHIDWSCARKLTQPIFESYRDVYDACESVSRGRLGAGGGYDLVLGRRAERLAALGQGMRVLTVERREDRAVLRLLCMGNVNTVERAELFLRAWWALDEAVRTRLVDALNVHGRKGEPAVQMTYMPALLSRIRDERALRYALRFLGRGMVVTDAVDADAVVIERTVLGVLKRYVESGGFDEDPTVLDRVDVPGGVVAQRA